MFGEHPDGGKTEVDSRDVDFIENDFPRIGDVNESLDLYELEKLSGLFVCEDIDQTTQLNTYTGTLQFSCSHVKLDWSFLKIE